MTEHERRYFTIARLPNIHRLNGGSPITDQEREKAERHFIRYYEGSLIKPKRFDELINIHGKLNRLVDVSLAPPKVVNVWVRFCERRWLEKNLSVYLTLKEFKGDCLSSRCVYMLNVSLIWFDLEHITSQTGIATSKLRIFHLTGTQPMVMTFSAKRLYSYNVKEGDEFIIDEKP